MYSAVRGVPAGAVAVGALMAVSAGCSNLALWRWNFYDLPIDLQLEDNTNGLLLSVRLCQSLTSAHQKNYLT